MDTQKPEQTEQAQAMEQGKNTEPTEPMQEQTSAPAEQPVCEKTQEELDYEAGYYACCFRSH